MFAMLHNTTATKQDWYAIFLRPHRSQLFY